MEQQGVGRRVILKGITLGAVAVSGAVALGDLFQVISVPGVGKVALARAAIQIDQSLCSGCRTCEAVCSTYNCTGRNSSALSRIILEKEYILGDYAPKACYQCEDPACLRACPVAAIQVDKQSGTYARVIDERVCIGCQKCVEACAQRFQPSRPRYDSEMKRTVKCHLCFGDPQCVKYCPLGVLRVTRSENGLRVGYPLTKEV